MKGKINSAYFLKLSVNLEIVSLKKKLFLVLFLSCQTVSQFLVFSGNIYIYCMETSLVNWNLCRHALVVERHLLHGDLAVELNVECCVVQACVHVVSDTRYQKTEDG